MDPFWKELVMERRFELRKEELLADCQVGPDAFDGIAERLRKFAEPFLASLPSSEGKAHGHTYVSGLLSDLRRKNTEAIAYRHGEDRQVIQRFIGYAGWDHEPLLDELARQVAAEVGEADGVIVFDPSGFAKKGTESVGVQRQWCGRLGKTDNCQVGTYMGYVTRVEQVLVDQRLYLSKEWIADTARRTKCGVPAETVHRTRHEQALEMLAKRGRQLPHAWVTGDDEMGRVTWFRRELQERKEQYLLAVPGNTTVRDLEEEVPPQVATGPGRGRRKGARKAAFQQVHAWCDALPASAWTRLTIRDAEKGPLEAEVVSRRVESKVDRRAVGFGEVLFALRQRTAGGDWKYDYHLSNASRQTPLAEFARVANAEHRIEQCLQRGKGEAGLAESQARRWEGWYHHQTLSLVAVWFLVLETRRGKKRGAGVDGAAGAGGVGVDPAPDLPMRHARADCPNPHRAVAA
jgi:SRSO17 transposase